MINVKRTFFLTPEEAKQIGDYVVHNMPHYELEDGSILYTCGGGGADFSIEHWVSTNGKDGGRDIKTGLESISSHPNH